MRDKERIFTPLVDLVWVWDYVRPNVQSQVACIHESAIAWMMHMCWAGVGTGHLLSTRWYDGSLLGVYSCSELRLLGQVVWSADVQLLEKVCCSPWQCVVVGQCGSKEA